MSHAARWFALGAATATLVLLAALVGVYVWAVKEGSGG